MLLELQRETDKMITEYILTPPSEFKKHQQQKISYNIHNPNMPQQSLN